jgi:hypothetical protein
VLYIIFALIVVLVLGSGRLKPPHYIGLVTSPLVIYGVRKLMALLFGWRIRQHEGQLEALRAQQEVKIRDLKKATKYDSTQELLKKYGGAGPKPTVEKALQQGTKRKIAQPQQPQHRTGLPPPPTANIPGRVPQAPSTPPPYTAQRPNSPPSVVSTQSRSSPTIHTPNPSARPRPISPDSPGFAPNAFDSNQFPPAPSSYQQSSSHWYDRIIDVLLGEDETQARNRVVLLCQQCRLVNGQAPPGIKDLEELGRWRCGGCGAWNGTEKPRPENLAVEPPRETNEDPLAKYGRVAAAEHSTVIDDIEDEGEPVNEDKTDTPTNAEEDDK